MHQSAEEAEVRLPTSRGSAHLILFLTVFIDLLGFGIVIPFLPLFAKHLGVGAVGVGIVLSAYSAAQFLCAPFLGRLSDRVGRRPVLLIGLAGSAIGYALYGFADSFLGLLLSRLVHGACAATVSTAQAYMADITPEGGRTKAMGLIGAAFGLGFVLGPALGGLLGHSSLRIPAYFASVLSVLNFVFAWLELPESLNLSESGDRSRSHELGIGAVGRLIQAVKQPNLMRLLTVGFLATMVFAGLETTFALVAAGKYGLGPRGVGVALALAGLVQALTQGYFVGRLAKACSEPLVVRLGLLSLAIGICPLASFSNPIILFALLALAAIGYGLESPSVASLLTEFSDPSQKGEILGLNQSALSLARIVGPFVAGSLYQVAGASVPYLLSGVLMLGALWLAANITQPSRQN